MPGTALLGFLEFEINFSFWFEFGFVFGLQFWFGYGLELELGLFVIFQSHLRVFCAFLIVLLAGYVLITIRDP